MKYDTYEMGEFEERKMDNRIWGKGIIEKRTYPYHQECANKATKQRKEIAISTMASKNKNYGRKWDIPETEFIRRSWNKVPYYNKMGHTLILVRKKDIFAMEFPKRIPAQYRWVK